MALKLLHPKLRFDNWEPWEFYKRPADTRTTAELKASIVAWSRNVSEVKQILPELESMNPKHLGLVADTIELSQKRATSWSDVDMVSVPDNRPFSPLDSLMSILPIASKKNPHSIDFSQEVINNAGQVTSKFYLKDAAELDFLTMDGVDKNFEKGVPVVETLAKLALNTSSYNRPKFDKQEVFVDYVLALLDEKVKVNKIPLLKPVLEASYGTVLKVFDLDKFLSDNVPIKVIKKNLETLPEASNEAYSFGKTLNINTYLSRSIDEIFSNDSQDVIKVERVRRNGNKN